MPKALPHFDAPGLLAAVHQQDHGLIISTNDPTGFRRIAYAAGRANPEHRIHIYADPRSRKRFFLLKARVASAAPLEDTTHD